MGVGDEFAIPRHFASWDEYWLVRHDPALWLPYFREALHLAGISHTGIVMLDPSQYPHARAGDVVITIYPDPAIARNTFAMELEAHSLIANRGLPVPELVAHGEFAVPANGARWNWLIESAATGLPWSRAVHELPVAAAQRAATELGDALRRLHEVPHDTGRMLKPDWRRFTDQIEDELAHLGFNDARMDAFPRRLWPAVRELAASTYYGLDTTEPTSLVHGDIHGGNIFIEPDRGGLRCLIDLNEMYAGSGWYDLADACFRLLGGDPQLTPGLLSGYGIDPAAQGQFAVRLLGWALLHDFDGISAVAERRAIPASINSIAELARTTTGIQTA